MQTAPYLKMLLSYHEGWDALRKHRVTPAQTFWRLVLPFSLVPVAMISYAATMYGDYYAPGVIALRWYALAGMFLLAELVTVPIMALVIHSLMTQKGARADFGPCFLLATVTAIPMWLSALGLFVPNMVFNAACGLAGLIAAGAMLTHGIPPLLGGEPGVESQDITFSVLSLGGLVWVLLIGLVVLPLLGY